MALGQIEQEAFLIFCQISGSSDNFLLLCNTIGMLHFEILKEALSKGGLNF